MTGEGSPTLALSMYDDYSNFGPTLQRLAYNNTVVSSKWENLEADRGISVCHGVATGTQLDMRLINI
jgi:peptide subunit release factor RF-3